MQLTKLEHVEAGGHIAARDLTINNYAAPKSQIAQLYEQLKVEAHAAPAEQKTFIEDLQHFMDRRATLVNRSLAEKLFSSNRSELLEDAEEAKERAFKRIVRFQSSPTAQAIFAYTLGDIRTRFNQYVRPLIAENANRSAIDAAIHQHVISPIVESAEPSELGINPTLAEALYYFLAGNCHIKWD